MSSIGLECANRGRQRTRHHRSLSAMSCAFCRCCPHRGASLPLILARRPAARQGSHLSQTFTTSAARSSQIGRAPLSIPPEVTFTVLEPSMSATRAKAQNAMRQVQIKGPLGEMAMSIPPYLQVEHNAAARKATLSILDRQERRQREMWGTTRAYLQNHIRGVSEGHTTLLRLVGVGYRATIENTAVTKKPQYPGQQFVSLKVGYSHPIELPIPKNVKASTPQPTRILLEGVEKAVINQFAAEIRQWRVPEPYKGKVRSSRSVRCFQVLTSCRAYS
ncbi:hypothetical protein MRB53_040558 [Persea americana]|nr:hypothetical protein MRB53_040558 [Persea americana]